MVRITEKHSKRIMSDDEEWEKVANARRPLEISPGKGCLLSKLMNKYNLEYCPNTGIFHNYSLISATI